MKRSYKINYKYGSQPKSEVVGGLKAGRFYSSNKSGGKRHTKPNIAILIVKLIGFLLFTKKGLKITGLLILISWFLSTIEVSYKPFNEPVKAQETIQEPFSSAKSFESADPSVDYRDTISREGRGESVEDVIRRVFGKDADLAVKIAGKEQSNWNTNAHNYNSETKDDSWGIFQVNLWGDLKKDRPTPEQLQDPEFNIKYAKMLFDSAGTFCKDWATSCKKLGIK